MTTNQTVWVCIATYAPEDDVPPLCAVAFTAQEAAEQIDNVIHKHCGDVDGERNHDDWIVHDPIERPVLPVDATPRGVDAWRAAGIPEKQIDEWFDDMIDLIDPKDEVRKVAATMTAADFREDYAEMFDEENDND